MKLNIANLVTLSRIIFALLLPFCDTFSTAFYLFYLLGACSDMIDGMIARKLNQISAFGSRLDSITDLIFITIVFMKICYAIFIPHWIWIWIIMIAFIKIVNLISSLVIYHKLVFEHTIMNKITGVLLFLFPLYFYNGLWQSSEIMVIITGLVATFAAVQEGHYLRIGKLIQ